MSLAHYAVQQVASQEFELTITDDMYVAMVFRFFGVWDVVEFSVSHYTKGNSISKPT